jgi:SpoVK/Ycf46/Vps4 family AAA+-type ATPase
MEQRSQVLVIGATNNVALVDPAALRPGRFGVHLYVGLPSAEDRAEIVRIHLRRATLEPKVALDDLVERLVASTEGFSGADLAFLAQSAKLAALERRGSDGLTVALAESDFDAAIAEIAARAPAAVSGRPE